MEKIIIIGGTSGIGRELARLYSHTDAIIGIIGRDKEKLDEIHRSNPEKYRCMSLDISASDLSCDSLDRFADELGGVDTVIVTAGTGELNENLDFQLEKPTISTNVTGWTLVVDWAFNRLKKSGGGHIVAVTSVAGLRGDGTAPAYNASKAYQINYLEGLHKKATKQKLPIFITDIRPGFINTRMAKGEGLFWVASVGKAGSQIFNAIRKKKNIAYITKRWSLVAYILKTIPTRLYCKIL